MINFLAWMNQSHLLQTSKSYDVYWLTNTHSHSHSNFLFIELVSLSISQANGEIYLI